MALTAFQIQQKAEALQRYIDIYGIKLLDKISQEKHKLNFSTSII